MKGYMRIKKQYALAVFLDEYSAKNATQRMALDLKGKPIVCKYLAVISTGQQDKVNITEYGKNGPLHKLMKKGRTSEFTGTFIGGLALCLFDRIDSSTQLELNPVEGLTGSSTCDLTGLTVDNIDKDVLYSLDDLLSISGSSILVAVFGDVIVRKSDFYNPQAFSDIQTQRKKNLVPIAVARVTSALREQRVLSRVTCIDEDRVAATRTVFGNVDFGDVLLTPNIYGEAAKHVSQKEEGIFVGGSIVEKDALMYEVTISNRRMIIREGGAPCIRGQG